MPATVRSLCLTAALAGVTAVRAADQTALPKESPFVPAAVAATAAQAGEIYEFAAVNTIGKKTTVSIYDKSIRKGRMIAVGETVDGISVLNYDPKREVVVVKIGGGPEKVLPLRKSTTTTGGAMPAPVAQQPTGFNNPNPVPTPGTLTLSGGSSLAIGPMPSATPAPKPAEAPPQPGSIAHQEQEARMLVSDLLEIGMAQRKAYEEAQRKAAEQGTAQPSTTAPAASPAAGK